LRGNTRCPRKTLCTFSTGSRSGSAPEFLRRNAAVLLRRAVVRFSQTASHTSPMAPVTTKAPRQLETQATRSGNTSGTAMLPILAPELKIPVARGALPLGKLTRPRAFHARGKRLPVRPGPAGTWQCRTSSNEKESPGKHGRQRSQNPMQSRNASALPAGPVNPRRTTCQMHRTPGTRPETMLYFSLSSPGMMPSRKSRGTRLPRSR